jgi:hypothetical protein
MHLVSMVPLSLVHDNHHLHLSFPDSATERIIDRSIEGIQKLLNPQHSNNTTPEEEEAATAVN